MTKVPLTRTVEKTMTLSPTEFAKSLSALAGGDSAITGRHATLDLNDQGGSAEIVYMPLAPRRVGGLLNLPQAKVTITFSGVQPIEAEAFLRRFDIAFQRGGG